MGSTGLLVVSSLKNTSKVLASVRDYVSSILYGDLHLLPKRPLPQWSTTVADIYQRTLKDCPNIDVRVLVTSLKNKQEGHLNRNINALLFDQRIPSAVQPVQDVYKINVSPIYLSSESNPLAQGDEQNAGDTEQKKYDTVVLGGTFDRMHVGHKILLNEAVWRARRRVVVGVTAPNMLASKKLHELILPLDKRINNVREFLQDIDNTLSFEVVAIEDFMGPTRTDPNMDLLIVSEETKRGGEKINEIRSATGLKPLDIYTIPLYEDEVEDDVKEKKVSSSNARMDILGVRIREPEPRPHLPKLPHIIGLTGGIASGKSVMASRFEKRGAKIINCDLTAHQIYNPGTDGYNKLIETFGKEVSGDASEAALLKCMELALGDVMTILSVGNRAVFAGVERVDEVIKGTEQTKTFFFLGWSVRRMVRQFVNQINVADFGRPGRLITGIIGGKANWWRISYEASEDHPYSSGGLFLPPISTQSIGGRSRTTEGQRGNGRVGGPREYTVWRYMSWCRVIRDRAEFASNYLTVIIELIGFEIVLRIGSEIVTFS